MRRECFKAVVLIGCLSLVSFPARAQEVVHALCGTVRTINSNSNTIMVGTDDDATELFKEFPKSNVSLDFDKRIRADAIVASDFKKSGDRVILYYFGSGNAQTAVAFQDLGTGPFKESSGTIVKFDRHEQVLTLKNNSGVEESFHLNLKTVAETGYGAVEGLELDAKVGDQVQVTSSSVNGNETALFILAS